MTDGPFELLNQTAHVSHETFERLSVYHDLLLKWQKKVNLIGPDTVAQSWQRHFQDSLQLWNMIPDPTKSLIDFGTGAGFPGMVLAIMGATNIHLIESDGKKILFLKEVARLTKTRVFIHHVRVESRPIETADILVCRAFAGLAQLLTLAFPYVSHETICLFPKGKNYSTELEDAKRDWVFDHTVTPSVTNEQGVILKLSNIRQRGSI